MRKKAPKNILLEMEKRRAKMEKAPETVVLPVKPVKKPWKLYHYVAMLLGFFGTWLLLAALGVVACAIWSLWDEVPLGGSVAEKVMLTCTFSAIPPLVLGWITGLLFVNFE